jgi:hypothetical protein
MEVCKYRKEPKFLQDKMNENIKQNLTGPIAIAGSQENKPVCELALQHPMRADGFFDCAFTDKNDTNCPMVEWFIK